MSIPGNVVQNRFFVEPLYDLAGYKLAYSNSKKARKVSYHKLSLYFIRIFFFYPNRGLLQCGPQWC